MLVLCQAVKSDKTNFFAVRLSGAFAVRDPFLGRIMQNPVSHLYQNCMDLGLQGVRVRCDWRWPAERNRYSKLLGMIFAFSSKLLLQLALKRPSTWVQAL